MKHPKAKLLLAISALGLCSAIGVSKPMAIRAEGEEPETSETISSEVEETSEETSKDILGAIEVDGKTIEQWKRELEDASTRKAAIIELVTFSAFAAIYALFKLANKKDLLAMKDNSAKAKEHLAKAEEYEAELGKALLKAGEIIKEQADYTEELIALMAQLRKELGEDSEKSTEIVSSLLLLLIKNSPDCVKSEAYKEALKLISGETEDGEERND